SRSWREIGRAPRCPRPLAPDVQRGAERDNRSGAVRDSQPTFCWRAAPRRLGYLGAMSSPAVNTSNTRLLQTPFHKWHVEYGAKLVEYAGWEMPLLYTSIIEEHRWVRSSGGFFDVSHMGRLRFTGRHARKFLDRVCTRQILGMEDGQCRYSLVCNEQGGVRDDVLVYRFDDDEYLVVCNAANRAKLLRHFDEVRGDMVFRVEDQTESTAMAAIQGPKVMDVIAQMSREVPTLKRYRFVEKNLLVLKM